MDGRKGKDDPHPPEGRGVAALTLARVMLALAMPLSTSDAITGFFNPLNLYIMVTNAVFAQVSTEVVAFVGSNDIHFPLATEV